jgi:CRISPR system Cascade subunit CasE
MYRVHQRLSMAFPSATIIAEDKDFLKPYKPESFVHVHGQRTAEQAFLFRVDSHSGGNSVISVQSALKPDWDYAFHNAMHLLAAPPQIKPYDPHFQNGQLLLFRLLANPTCKKDRENRPADRNNYGRRVPVPRNEIEAWLIKRAAQYGFSVESFDNVQTGYVAAFKGKGESDDSRSADDEETERRLKRFFYARYEGKLRVTASDSIRNAIIQGIGPAKGFGFGLLSVAPLRM